MRADLCILGGGAAGLSLAAGAAQMGARTVLIERSEMGGDCLNTGCVPSKALLAAARLAASQRAGGLGIAPQTPQVDFAAVMVHVRRAIATIAPHDSVARFEGLGVRVIRASARFTGPQTLIAGPGINGPDFTGPEITARRFAIATGAAPFVPDLPGLSGALTTETLWHLDRLPEHLVIWGGGAVAAEMAQAFRRLGAAVTMVTRSGLLTREDPEAVDLLRAALLAEGVQILTASPTHGLPGGLAWAGGSVQGSHLLLALGRRPRLDFAPEAAGIALGPDGILTDARLRTSNPKIFALGDVAGQGQFTHLAGYQAGIVLRQAVLGLPAKVSAAIPRTVWTSPELAQIGRPAGPGDQVMRVDLAALDRGVTEGATGFAKVVLAKGRVVGVTLIGPDAGEQIALWALVLAAKVRPATVAGLVLPYPSLAEQAKRAMGNYFSPRLFENRLLKLIVRAVQRLVP